MSLVDRAIFKFFKAERTYSQAGEDKLLTFLFNSYGKKKITYLDVGTNHPKMGNNTYLFYRNGSRGVCVEPNPKLCKLIRKARPRDQCLNIGLSDGADGVAEFYSVSLDVLSTFSKQEALELEASGKYAIEEILTIPVRNINSVINEHFDSPIDLVSIDVEGWNEEIVRSLDFSLQRPFCFCIETLTFSENNSGEKLTGIIEVMESNSYSVFADTHVNTIFLDNKVSNR